MALIILQPNATSSLNVGSGSDTDIVFGAGGNETVRIDGDGKVELDPSWNAGGDTIKIDGLASDYSATVSGSNLILTNATGANISIPVGIVGATVEFLGGDSRTLVIKDGQLCLAEQILPADGSTVAVEGEAANQAPAFTDDELPVMTDEGTPLSDTLAGLAVDPDGDALSYSLSTGALNGSVTVNADGTYTYTPNANFSGSDQFVVAVTDGEASDTLVVNVTVKETGGTGGTGGTQSLSVAKDIVDGTSGDDTIRARVVQNNDGFQTNELGSGDFIDGKGGTDRLDAWVQDASPLGAGPGSSILPETTDVEIAHFRALSVGASNYDLGDLPVLFMYPYYPLEKGEFCDYSGPRIGVEINASDMFGLTEVGSVRSDDSLTIYNLTTLADDGTTIRKTEEVMVRMDHTGNNNAIDPESDLTVLFDRDYLLCDDPIATGGVFRFQIMDVDAVRLAELSGLAPAAAYGTVTYPNNVNYQSAGEIIDGPLDEIPYTEVVFKLGGDEFVIPLTDANGVMPVNYAELLANVQYWIAQDPGLNGSNVGAGGYNVTATFGLDFTPTDTDSFPGGTVGPQFAGQEIQLTNESGPEVFTDVTFTSGNTVPGDKDTHLQPFFGTPEGGECKIEVDVKLEKVGRGGDGGELTIGGMTPDLDNNWDEESLSGVPELPRGVEQFNVQVLGNADQPSSLAALRSTDNTLQCIIIEDEGDSEATLTIGNRNTSAADGFDAGFYDTLHFEECDVDCDVSSVKNNALKDVLIFDASKFDNDTEVHGHFSEETVAKYLDLTDTDPNAYADDVTAMYTFGSGDNILNMNISKMNMAVQGAITRGDFSFYTDTGAGNDTVLIQLGDGEADLYQNLDGDFAFGGDSDGNWYTNHLLNENLTIKTQDGDDYVNTWGASAAVIEAGAGDDVVFTDNSGGVHFGAGECYNCGRSTWIFNARNNDVQNLESKSVATLTNAANLAIVVQFQDFTARVNIADTVGSVNGVTLTDLDIVQAIKAAINDHPVLGDFLVAEDGPGRTLVVRSLVDGVMENTDLSVRLVQTGPLSAQQLAGNAETLGDFTAAELAAFGFNPDGSAIEVADGVDPSQGGRWDSDQAYDSKADCDLIGEDSQNMNNNRVEGGLGNDEIALSSTENAIEHVVITGAFGTDHILNFSAGAVTTTTAAQPEIQQLTFSVTDTDPLTDPDETQQDADLTLTVGGVDYVVNSMAGATAADLAAAFAAAINADPTGVATASVTGAVLTLTYNTPNDGTNWGLPTGSITSPSPTETQVVTIAGTQTDAETVTISFAGWTADVDIPAGSTANDIESLLVTYIQNNAPAEIDASINGSLDGSFNLLYYGNTDPAAATFTFTTNNPEVNTTITAANGTFTPFNPGAIAAIPVTVQEGVPAGTAIGDFDIFDLSAIIGPGAPGYFGNQAQFGQSDDNTADEGVGSVEYGFINGLIDSNANGVVLVDIVDGSADDELTELQALVTAADATAHGGGQTNTSVIITVGDTNRVDAGDDDGLFGNFYKVVDGAQAGDATVEYLGTVYLGSYDWGGKEAIGDWEAMTAVNFTPLTPTQIIDSFGAVI
ncbi:MAG: cadherin-like domain-containing protein [Sphingomonadaceae bacterium]